MASKAICPRESYTQNGRRTGPPRRRIMATINRKARRKKYKVRKHTKGSSWRSQNDQPHLYVDGRRPQLGDTIAQSFQGGSSGSLGRFPAHRLLAVFAMGRFLERRGIGSGRDRGFLS